MNILLLCDEYPPGRHGGIGTAVQLLARALVRGGHKVVVAGFYDWSYGGRDTDVDQGVQVYRYRRKLNRPGLLKKRDSLAVRTLYKTLTYSRVLERDIKHSLNGYRQFIEKLLNEHDIEILEMPDYQEYINYVRTPVYFPEWDIPTVVKLHGSMTYFRKEAGETVPNFMYLPERQIMRHASAIASVSDYTAVKTAAYFDIKDDIKVLYNGIDLPEKQSAVAREDGLVIYTGSLLPKKGIYQLAKAWNIVIQQVPNSALHIYGKGAINKVKALLSPTAQSSVYFHGHVSRTELMQQLQAASVAVYPSYAECFALAPMEAMIAGTAVINSSRTSGPELIRNEIDGLLIDPDDVEGLAKSIILLLSNAVIKGRLGRQGAVRVKENFGIDRIAADHVKYYQQVICDTKRQAID